MKKLIVLFIIVVALFTLVTFKINSANNAVEIEVAIATTSQLSETILASGNLVFKSQIQIRSELTGIVKEVLVKEGQKVKAGQLLMRLDPTSFEADVELNKAAVQAGILEIERARAVEADLSRQVRRHKALLKQKLIQQEVVDALQSKLDISKIDTKREKARLEQVQAGLLQAMDRLRKTVFVAAMDGLMVSVDIKPGETVIAGTTNIVGSDLMTLADPSAILAELRVDEADVIRLALGQDVSVYVPSKPDIPINGKVIFIGTSAKHLGGGGGLGFLTKVLLSPESNQLFPGMSCRAEIATAQSEQTLNVPVSSIVERDNKTFVWRTDGTRVTKVEVITGMATDMNQAVLSGLRVGEKVVTGPSRVMTQLKEGQRVEIKPLSGG